MHDLVRIAAQQEMMSRLQRIEDQRELGVGEILHLVDDDKIVTRLGLGEPSVRDEIQVEELLLLEPDPILFEEIVHGRARLARRVERLAYAERLILAFRQRPARGGAE